MTEEHTPDLLATAARDVFISYASQDKAVADAVCEALEKAGLQCWIAPRDVRPGTVYADAIVGAINESKTLVLVLSANAMPSAHVGREVERAASKRKQLIAFRVDTTPLSRELEYFLSNSQWIDVGPGGIHAATAKLIDAIRGHLTPGTPSAPYKPPAVDRQPAPPQRRWIAIASAALLAMVLAYFVAPKFRLTGHVPAEQPATGATPATTISEKSIAVLPFTDMSEKHDQEYFSEGLSEELIDLLSRVSALRVPARTSSFYFKDRSEDIPTIARRLMVAHVLEGSVRKAGDHVRITVQLVRADNGYHLWSQTYDRKLDDIFKVQDEIAAAVVAALKVSLLGAEVPRAIPTANSEAYTLYLQARSVYWNGSTHADSERAFALLRKALELDPGFARGWAALAMYLCGDASYFDFSLDAHGRREAHDAAARSLALDPELSDSHAAMGRFLLMIHWDWKGAEAELRRALTLDPFQDVALLDLPDLLAMLDIHSAEALSLAKRAIDHDPTNMEAYLALGYIYSRAGRFAEAEQAMRTAVDLSPRAEASASLLASLLLYRGDPIAALAELEREPGERWREALRPQVLDALGRAHEADSALAAFEAKFGNAAPYSIAAVYAKRKDLDRAFDWLDRAYRQREPLILYVGTDLDFSNLRPDPRLRALLQKLNLPG